MDFDDYNTCFRWVLHAGATVTLCGVGVHVCNVELGT